MACNASLRNRPFPRLGIHGWSLLVSTTSALSLGHAIGDHIDSYAAHIHGTHAFGLLSRQLNVLMILVDEADFWFPRRPDGGCGKHEMI